MKVVVQRVSQASVTVEETLVSSISNGLMLLVCLEKNDTQETLLRAAKKIAALRIFSDEQGKMNKNITDITGSILAVSQFTLSWNGQKGNRPSFDASMLPDEAQNFFNDFCQLLEKESTRPVKKGSFGADMKVSLVNDGPVTFHLSF